MNTYEIKLVTTVRIEATDETRAVNLAIVRANKGLYDWQADSVA